MENSTPVSFKNSLNITWSDECCPLETLFPYIKGVELLSKAVNITTLFKANVKPAEKEQPNQCGRIFTRVFVFCAGAGMLLPFLNIPIYLFTRTLLEPNIDNSKNELPDDVKKFESGKDKEQSDIERNKREEEIAQMEDETKIINETGDEKDQSMNDLNSASKDSNDKIEVIKKNCRPLFFPGSEVLERSIAEESQEKTTPISEENNSAPLIEEIPDKEEEKALIEAEKVLMEDVD